MGERSKREAGWAGCEGVEPREREERAERSSMGFAGGPEGGEGTTSSKSKSIRETWAAAFWALVFESVVAKLREKSEYGGEGVRGGRTHVASTSATAVRSPALNASYRRTTLLIRSFMSNSRSAHIISFHPRKRVQGDAPIASGLFSALSSIHFCSLGCT